MKNYFTLAFLASISLITPLSFCMDSEHPAQDQSPRPEAEQGQADRPLIVIPSYNNEEWYRKSIAEIFDQHYSARDLMPQQPEEKGPNAPFKPNNVNVMRVRLFRAGQVGELRVKSW